MFYQGLLKFTVHFYNLTFNNRSYNLVFETEELSDARKNMMSIGQTENHTLMNVRFWHKADVDNVALRHRVGSLYAATDYFTSSKSPGFQVLSNQACSGP